ncbi:protocatechuate 3,4-dioxygenase subunit alpha [Palleronia abyssalis]|uniref:Protocatechuate 3,4-dioxygenase alpha chain n=1 Tax=Palleronia abyssalis TaxID=1501240 RepID=A0A2R8BQZ9_9RHOB|nr:protocatechuate 3,4-dioxygenase subunit alpha [Palleronia abyssalis]SPJ22614.1 Protocatechuate 3,4-dioxygenase alpha chain [Palleronia abyssalis]
MPLEYPKETPAQTAGPFVHIGAMPRIAGFTCFDVELGQQIAGPDVPGERIVIEGQILDGTGTPCRDTMVEVWQADDQGRYAHPEDPRGAEVADGFTGFGRAHTDFDTGLFRFETIKPGIVPGRHGRDQAPHVSFWIVARGINIGLHTRMYFPEDNTSTDPVLSMIEQPHRRDTLIAERTADGQYRFDIRLQGDRETVFLDV